MGSALYVRCLPAVLGLVFAVSCTSAGPAANVPGGVTVRQAHEDAHRYEAMKLEKPALISLDDYTKDLIYWPTAKGPRGHPITLSRGLDTSEGFGMAAQGNTIVISGSPHEILTYDVKTAETTTHTDDFGLPYDVAIDKNGNIYAMHAASVTRFAAGSYAQRPMFCSYINTGESIAVDNQGDVFVDGYGAQDSLVVVEYPATGKPCRALQLQAQEGYPAGVGIDPKTDDLIVIDDPDYCAGGYEGRMIIYKRPYKASGGITHNLNAVCAGTFRLDGASKNIYLEDETVSGLTLITSRTYPDARRGGSYRGHDIQIRGFTTIPNRLPN